MADLLVLGNGLAGLIVALERARRGDRVCLLSDGRQPGGHFTGLQVDSHDFDIGMVMFERHAPLHPCNDLADFQPSQRNDWTRFGHLAWDWLGAQTPLCRVPTPQCRVAGRTGPDYLIANRLDMLSGAAFPPPQPAADHPLHPAHKAEPGPYDELSYREAAELNHGAELHRALIEPFVRKLVPDGCDQLLARLHRGVWAPLYHPQTLRLALSGAPTALPEYPFWTTPHGDVSAWVRAMLAELAGYPHAELITEPLAALSPGSTWSATTLDGRSFDAPRAVLALAVDRATQLLGSPKPAALPAASVCVLLCTIGAPAYAALPSCLLVADDLFTGYRMTSPDAMAGLSPPRRRLVYEANPDVVERRHPGRDPGDVLRTELLTLLGLPADADLRVHRMLTARNSLPLPTRQAVQASAETCRALGERIGASSDDSRRGSFWLTGNLLGFGVASINDQIVQALQITEALNP